LVLFIKILPV